MKPFLRVVIETHDSKLEMDTRCGTSSFIEARAIEAIRAGCVGMLMSEDDEFPRKPIPTRPTDPRANPQPGLAGIDSPETAPAPLQP